MSDPAGPIVAIQVEKEGCAMQQDYPSNKGARFYLGV